MDSQRPSRKTLYMKNVAAFFLVIPLIGMFTNDILAQPNTSDLLAKYRNEVQKLSDRLIQKEQELEVIRSDNFNLRNDKKHLEQKVDILKNRIRELEVFLFNRSQTDINDLETVGQALQRANIDLNELERNFEDLTTNFIRSSFHVFYASEPGPSSSIKVLRRPVNASSVRYLEFNFSSIKSPSRCYVSVIDRDNRIYVDLLPVAVENYKGAAFVKVNLPPGYYTVYIRTSRNSADYVCYDFSLF